MASELVLDLAGGDIPDTDDLVLGTSGQVLAVGAETHAPDVEITILRKAAVLEMCDWVSGIDIEDLGRAIATSCNIATVKTEAHTAHDALMGQVVDEVDVEHTPSSGVEDSVPVVTLPLVLCRQLLDVQISQTVSLGQRQRRLVLSHQGILLVRRRGWAGHLRRARVRSRVVLLRSCWAARRAARRTRALTTRRGSGLRGLAVR